MFSLFPQLVQRIPQDAQPFEDFGSCGIVGVATVPARLAVSWCFAGGLPREGHAGDAFVAAIRARQTEELIVIMVRGHQTFSFLEKYASPWTNPREQALHALDEAFARWDAGEIVCYVHRFQ